MSGAPIGSGSGSDSIESVIVTITCAAESRIHDARLSFSPDETVLEVKKTILSIIDDTQGDPNRVLLIFMGRILPMDDKLSTLQNHYRRNEQIPTEAYLTFHAVIRTRPEASEAEAEAERDQSSRPTQMPWMPFFLASRSVQSTGMEPQSESDSASISSTPRSTATNALPAQPALASSLEPSSGVNMDNIGDGSNRESTTQPESVWNDPSVTSYSLIHEETNLRFPSYKALVLNTPGEGHIVCFSPDVLEQLESHIGPENVGGRTLRVTASPGTSTSSENQDGQNQENDNQDNSDQDNGMWNLSDNRFVRLRLNPSLIGHTAVNWLPFILRTWVFMVYLAMSLDDRLQDFAILGTILGVPIFSYIYNTGWVHRPFISIRDFVTSYLPHGLPQELGAEEFSQLQTDSRRTENNAVADSDVNEESAVTGTRVSESASASGGASMGEDLQEPLTPILRYHTANQTTFQKFKSCVLIFFASMVPSWYDNWAQEERRRRESVSRSIRELETLNRDSHSNGHVDIHAE